jgi:eukaryotic-like serine/threonine-protein kinase
VLFYVMPYVEGETLRARLSRSGSLSVADSVAIWRDLLDALAAAHRGGIVHCDIKPENILLSGRNALVVDFGIARAVKAAAEDADPVTPGVTVGTPAYMAPEQVFNARETDHRVDIYAAGLVMYEMLAGRSPFSGLGVRETLTAQRERIPSSLARADVSPKLSHLIKQCIAKEPGLRPATADAVLAELDDVVGGTARARSRTFALAAAAGVAVIAIVTIAAVFASQRGPAVNDEVAAIAADSARPSLVVLPLIDLSSDKADASLVQGMTEELIGNLSRNPNLRVIGNASLDGTRRSARAIADSVNVSNVLEGSLQKIGSRLRMWMRLIDTRDGSTRWSQVYDRDMKNVFAMQDEVTRSVSAELDARLRPGARRVTPSRYTPNISAYEWYLRGMDVSLMRTDSGTRRGIDYFNRAIQADSGFAAAYAGLTRLYLQTGASSPEHRTWLARAESAAVKAISLDDSLAEGHAALGWVLGGMGRFSAAESELKLALALNPAAPRAHEGLARIYMEQGRPAEQLEEAKRGLASDPFSHSAIREMGLALNMNRRCDESLELLAPLKKLNPPAGIAGVISGQCYLYKRMWPEAIAELRWTVANAHANIAPAFLGYALARGGHPEEARKILADLLANRTYSRGPVGIAIVYAGLKDYDRAFEWLEKAAEQGRTTQYIFDPMFADLHRDPRFARLNFYADFQKR